MNESQSWNPQILLHAKTVSDPSFLNKNYKDDLLSLNITEKTTRQALFHIIYQLQEQNAKLVNKLEANKVCILGQSFKQNIIQSSQQQRDAIIQSLQRKNLQNLAQVKMMDLYKRQNQIVKVKIMQKNIVLNKLRKEQQEMQNCNTKMAEKLKQLSERLIKQKQIRTQLSQQLQKKQNQSRLSDTIFMDKILAQYYETIKQVKQQKSIQKINLKTKQALKQLNKKKGALGWSINNGKS